MTERRPGQSRKMGIAGASLIFAGAGALEACTPGAVVPSNTETPRPTEIAIATYSPSPIDSINPTVTLPPSETPTATPEITAAPTPEITPAPTPEITPKPEPMAIETITQAEKHPAVSATQVGKDLNNLYDTNPKAQTIYPFGKQNWDECLKSQHIAEKKVGCLYLVNETYKVYKQTGDMNAYNLAMESYNYAIGAKGPYRGAKAELDTYLEKFN